MDSEYDIVVIGSGAAGLTAAAIAASEKLRTLVVEKQTTLGGTTMLSGGTVWVPNNHISKQHGIRDSEDAASKYINAAIGPDKDIDLDQDIDPDKEEFARLMARNRKEYLGMAPKMISYFEKSLRWTLSKFPDYQPNLEGALPTGGRTLSPEIFDARRLRSSKHFLDFSLSSNVRHFEGYLDATRLSSQADLEDDPDGSLRSRLHLSMGCSLIAQLLLICEESSYVTILTDTTFRDVLLKENKVVGVVLSNEHDRWTVGSHSVFLGVAGFARNQAMRKKHLQKPASVDWTLARPNGDDGKVLELMMSKGAKTSFLQGTWGIPTIQDPLDGQNQPGVFVLSKPHCIVVNADGRRFCNEARPYGDYNCYADTKAPSWLILDSEYLRKYTLGSLRQEAKIEKAVASQYLKRALTIQGLAKQLNIPPDNLTITLGEWNSMCDKGEDTDFGRGGDEYQRFIGDESMEPNPNMGSIMVPPFYAIRVFPGDAGTKSGLLTDEKARIIFKGETVIDGLYASGNVTASPFGKTSIGAGITIGPAMTFAYAAIKHLCKYLKTEIAREY